MNRLYYLLLVVLLGSCLGYKELPVEYDYSYHGNFKRYRTYDLMKPIGFSDSTMTNKTIEKSIVSRMKFLGYKQSDHRPHLIVAYKMFADSLQFSGYKQPEIEDWMENKRNDDLMNYDKQKFNMTKGTLLIQFFDRRQNRSIWQGYATMVYGSIDFNNDRHVRNAVISILDKYRFWAEGFIDGRQPVTETDLE
jgi:hypothetical protein